MTPRPGRGRLTQKPQTHRLPGSSFPSPRRASRGCTPTCQEGRVISQDAGSCSTNGAAQTHTQWDGLAHAQLGSLGRALLGTLGARPAVALEPQGQSLWKGRW